MALEAVGDVALGGHEHIARQADNPFIPSATGSCRQFCNRCIGDVYADDGEVAIFEFPNVRASIAPALCRAVGVRVRADAIYEHI